MESGVAQITSICQTLLRIMPPGDDPASNHSVQRIERRDSPAWHQQGIEASKIDKQVEQARRLNKLNQTHASRSLPRKTGSISCEGTLWQKRKMM